MWLKNKTAFLQSKTTHSRESDKRKLSLFEAGSRDQDADGGFAGCWVSMEINSGRVSFLERKAGMFSVDIFECKIHEAAVCRFSCAPFPTSSEPFCRSLCILLCPAPSTKNECSAVRGDTSYTTKDYTSYTTKDHASASSLHPRVWIAPYISDSSIHF